MQRNQALSITYKSYWKESESEFEVEPYCVKVFKQRWYLIARNAFGDVRIYALDRIHEAVTIDRHFTLPEDFDGQAMFHNCFGVITGSDFNTEFVDVKVYGTQVEYFKSLPLHHSQKEIKITHEYSVFSYFIQPTYDFQKELISQGECVEVLSPLWFRDKLENDIKKMLNRYNKN